MTIDSDDNDQSANDTTEADSSKNSAPGFTALTGLAVVVAASLVAFRKRADRTAGQRSMG